MSEEDDDAMPKPFVIKQEPEEKSERTQKQKKQPIKRPKTPEGFWNPHIVSFASDDIRKQVLIDYRFKDL